MNDKRFGGYLILIIFFGWFGVHRFATRKIVTGLLYLFTFGFFGFGVLVDVIMLTLGKFKDKDNRPIPSLYNNQPFLNSLTFASPVALMVIALFIGMYMDKGTVNTAAPAMSSGRLTTYSAAPSPSPVATVPPATPSHTAAPTTEPVELASPTAEITATPDIITASPTATPVPKMISYQVTFKSASITHNGKIGDEWQTYIEVNGKKVTKGKSITVKLSTAEQLTIRCVATEKDKIPDVGETTIAFQVGAIKSGTQKIAVAVIENAGKKSGQSTDWSFVIDIRKK